jgi:hypothetical protein
MRTITPDEAVAQARQRGYGWNVVYEYRNRPRPAVIKSWERTDRPGRVLVHEPVGTWLILEPAIPAVGVASDAPDARTTVAAGVVGPNTNNKEPRP